ncbi:ATP-binding protein [Polyangium spumosum]|uniref:histidine kinase n=1 Tax=Polyangium spumosum TaxID=889282 RepID=A0A6N7PR90_9BACT|nr:ATP-binding protein [Polyangium spumosum]MRG94503.1 response regulator [Polyangium spumosum]
MSSSLRKKIFIVEDQRIVAADLENTLLSLGYDVAGSAASGERAIEKVLASRPDLVLMDIRLEGKMDGIQAAERIRAELDVPIVYLTAYADEETILRAKTTSPFGYLVKPFNERELRGAIEIALYKHETDRILHERKLALAEEEARRRASERAVETQAFLDETTLLLTSSLETEGTLQKAAELAVPRLGDLCFVDLANDKGILVVCAAAGAPEDQAITAELSRTISCRLGADYAFQNGGKVLHEEVQNVDCLSHLLGTTDLDHLRALGPISYICVPIELRGKRLGVVELVRRTERGRYDTTHLGVAQELARRFGIALDNARLYREAQEAIRVRDEFFMIASHELRTPLTPLQLQLEALERSLRRAGLLNEHLTGRVERCSRQIFRLTRLVETLLDVTRITAGQLLIEPEVTDLCALVREVADRFAMEAHEAGSTIELRACESLRGQWDPMRLDQVLSNLLENAVKYGCGRPIDVEVVEEDDVVRIAVTDRGLGIAPEACARIFERFERAVSLRHYGGLGLGLFIARQIVEAHGGTIEATSQPGAGSTFTVTLPRWGVAAASEVA